MHRMRLFLYGLAPDVPLRDGPRKENICVIVCRLLETSLVAADTHVPHAVDRIEERSKVAAPVLLGEAEMDEVLRLFKDYGQQA